MSCIVHDTIYDIPKEEKVMKNYEFIDAIKGAVTEVLKDEGMQVFFDRQTISKMNHDDYEALTVRPEGSNIGFNLNLDEFADALENGKSIQEVCDTAVSIVLNAIKNLPDFDLPSLENYEKMKDLLIIELVNTEENREMLENIPHREIEDLSAIYRFRMPIGQDAGTILINNAMIKNYGITTAQLDADAMAVATKNSPAVVRGIFEMLSGMSEQTGIELGDVDEETASNGDNNMLVITNTQGNMGASVILQPGILERVSRRMGGSYYILPSSIHEVLAVSGEVGNADSLRAMVREVNDTQVEPAERLGYNVYRYDAETKCLAIA